MNCVMNPYNVHRLIDRLAAGPTGAPPRSAVQRQTSHIINAASLVACLCWATTARQAFALGEEKFGNEPVHVQGFDGLDPVANHRSRVYWNWVNGQEQMFYRGEAAQLNDVLEAFADSPLEVHTVILRPGPGETISFHGEAVPFNWSLEFYGGISAHLTKEDKGDRFWPKWPVLWIHVDEERIRLEKLAVPENVQILEVSDLRQRYLDGLTSSDNTVRGWGCGHLASLDSSSLTDAVAVAKVLDDPDGWVRLNAAGAIRRYGATAQPLLPALNERLENETDPKVKARLQESMREIESAEADPTAITTHATRLLAIHRFRVNHDRAAAE